MPPDAFALGEREVAVGQELTRSDADRGEEDVEVVVAQTGRDRQAIDRPAVLHERAVIAAVRFAPPGRAVEGQPIGDAVVELEAHRGVGAENRLVLEVVSEVDADLERVRSRDVRDVASIDGRVHPGVAVVADRPAVRQTRGLLHDAVQLLPTRVVGEIEIRARPVRVLAVPEAAHFDHVARAQRRRTPDFPGQRRQHRMGAQDREVHLRIRHHA